MVNQQVKIIFIIVAFVALATQYIWSSSVAYEKAIAALIEEAMNIQQKSRSFSRLMRKIPIVGGLLVPGYKLPCNLESVSISGNGGTSALVEKGQLVCLELFTRKTVLEMHNKLKSGIVFRLSQFLLTVGLVSISVGLAFSIMVKRIRKSEVHRLKKKINKIISNLEDSERLTNKNNDEVLKDEIDILYGIVNNMANNNVDKVRDEISARLKGADKSTQTEKDSRKESSHQERRVTLLNKSTQATQQVTETGRTPDKKSRNWGTQWSKETEMSRDKIEDAQTSSENAKNNENSQTRETDNDYCNSRKQTVDEEEAQVGTQPELSGVEHQQDLYSKFPGQDILYQTTKDFLDILVLKKEDWDMCTLKTTKEEFTWIVSCPEDKKKSKLQRILRGISKRIKAYIKSSESKDDKDHINTQVSEKANIHGSTKPSPAAVEDRNTQMSEKAKRKMQPEIAGEEQQPFSRYPGSDVVLYRNNTEFLEIRLLKSENKCWQKCTVETTKRNKKRSEPKEERVGSEEKSQDLVHKSTEEKVDSEEKGQNLTHKSTEENVDNEENGQNLVHKSTEENVDSEEKGQNLAHKNTEEKVGSEEKFQNLTHKSTEENVDSEEKGQNLMHKSTEEKVGSEEKFQNLTHKSTEENVDSEEEGQDLTNKSTEEKIGSDEKSHEWTNKEPKAKEIIKLLIEQSRSKIDQSYGHTPFSEKDSTMFEEYFSWYLIKKKSKMNVYSMIKNILKIFRNILETF